ncbi:hypothetical protein GQ55_9G132700 [Panicum hallii var. hallii]|uniref:Uncharacterized protein n=1 Tax=Panicum hallii var. hallii TaxID=1504633 RepID=A0A2T7C2P3_9POAL|nr:hypothetical protein GQ55_9G132700 [Panicum hallii var. hallii]
MDRREIAYAMNRFSLERLHMLDHPLAHIYIPYIRHCWLGLLPLLDFKLITHTCLSLAIY